MIKRTFLILSSLLVALPVWAADGMVNHRSVFTASITSDRFERVLSQKDMTVYGRILHSAAAKRVGVELRHSELFIFGNPKVGSPLMKCQQSAALDLPQKVLIWQDETGVVWLSYNDPGYLKQRHRVEGCDAVVDKVKNALEAMAKAATQP